jgi:hypothetical protein
MEYITVKGYVARVENEKCQRFQIVFWMQETKKQKSYAIFA